MINRTEQSWLYSLEVVALGDDSNIGAVYFVLSSATCSVALTTDATDHFCLIVDKTGHVFHDMIYESQSSPWEKSSMMQRIDI